ncbi:MULTISPECIES: RICIN domain-containing protein [Kitasatospora]|uniref:RICIN domain-containing protein n=1 Tax=Kitasatospora TaxID=2063 RepID=UPI000C704476|nr:RICIN domain-containing protein [Kitasatospora sp. GP30]MDH6145829.1 O-glycosyl hydrolase [Kitasatospora sp. GP30]
MRTAPRALLALLSLCLALLTAPTAATAAPRIPGTAVTVDGNSPGRTFDGVGAISGGGGNSRLLLDYPEPQRSQILDYLFKPGYGAALQILKVEIGGDTNSTDGAEASIEHSRGSIDCASGYEWWLMAQAKARNPGIKLYGLSWGAPGWIGNGSFWSQDMVDYLTTWLGCAKQHGLTIDYLGGWNERNYNASWYENLHSTLAARGFTRTKVVGADSFSWDVATAMQNDPALKSAIDIVGSHYPCGYTSTMTNCATSPDALATGKRLWASENGSEDADTGAAPIARGINRGYLDGKMTAFINWPVVAALYPNLGFNSMGLVTANEPWSGAYTVGRSTWAIAQTTQFTAPGWQYLDTASGYLAGDRANGSYVSYASPDRSAWSTVFETMDAGAAQTVTLDTAGGLPGGTLHVWSSDFSDPTAAGRLVRSPDLTAVDGSYQLTLQPGRMYTVTTTTGQGAGTATGPQRAPLSLPYRDSLAGTGTGKEARYFSAMNGAFQTAPCAGGRSGNCLRQQAPTTPIRWTDESADQPYTIMGDTSWSDYTVGVDALLQQSGTVDLLGRVGTQGRNNNGLDAYRLRVGDDGAWSILKTDTSWNFTTLAAGTVQALGLNTWHHLSLDFQGSTITARLDGTTLATVSDGDYRAGQIGLGTGGYYPAQFSRLTITGHPTAPLDGVYQLVNANSGQLLDAQDQGTSDGTPVIQWAANGGANQQWRLTGTGDGYYILTGVASGKVLDVPGGTSLPGTQLQLWTPNGGTGQQWQVVPADSGHYTLRARSDGDLVDVQGASLSLGAQAIQWPANGGANQGWQLQKVE